MIRIRAADFWPRYREECRSTGTRDSLRTDLSWTNIAVPAARSVCLKAGLEPCEELKLDVMGYEQRVKGVNFNWDLRVAFEHENNHKQWHEELCKLCHVVADLRVLVSYFLQWEGFEKALQDRVDLMGERMTRVPNSEWLFIFGPRESSKLKMPWVAYTLDDCGRLQMLPNV